MCAAAIALGAAQALRFAAEDPKGGGVIHGARIFTQPTCHHRPESRRDRRGGSARPAAGILRRSAAR